MTISSLINEKADDLSHLSQVIWHVGGRARVPGLTPKLHAFNDHAILPLYTQYLHMQMCEMRCV